MSIQNKNYIQPYHNCMDQFSYFIHNLLVSEAVDMEPMLDLSCRVPLSSHKNH